MIVKIFRDANASDQTDNHPSEQGWQAVETEHVIANTGNLDEYRAEVVDEYDKIIGLNGWEL